MVSERERSGSVVSVGTGRSARSSHSGRSIRQLNDRPASVGYFTEKSQFVIQRQIAQTNGGSVYLARVRRTGEQVVLKQRQWSELGKNKDFLREYDLLCDLSHPNVIECLGYFWDDPSRSLYIVLEYANRGDLHAELSARKADKDPFKDDQCWEIFLQMLAGLKNLHANKIVHRDIKPLNLLLTDRGMVKIGDFGVGRQMSQKTQFLNSFYGTPLYLSPELVEGHPYSYATDIWSLGVVLYEILTLRPPFDGNSLSQVTQSVLKGRFAPIPRCRDQDFARAIQWMLQVDAKKRPSAKELYTTFKHKGSHGLTQEVSRQFDDLSVSDVQDGQAVKKARRRPVRGGDVGYGENQSNSRREEGDDAQQKVRGGTDKKIVAAKDDAEFERLAAKNGKVSQYQPTGDAPAPPFALLNRFAVAPERREDKKESKKASDHPQDHFVPRHKPGFQPEARPASRASSRGRSRERSHSLGGDSYQGERESSRQRKYSLQEERDRYKEEKARSRSNSRSNRENRELERKVDQLSHRNNKSKDLRERIVEEQKKKAAAELAAKEKERNEKEERQRARDAREDKQKYEARVREERRSSNAQKQKAADEQKERVRDHIREHQLLEKDRDIWDAEERQEKYRDPPFGFRDQTPPPSGGYKTPAFTSRPTPRRFHGAEPGVSVSPPRERMENGMRVVRVRKRRDTTPTRSRSVTPNATPLVTPRDAAGQRPRSPLNGPHLFDPRQEIAAPLPWNKQQQEPNPHADYMGGNVGASYRRERSKERRENEDRYKKEIAQEYERYEVRAKDKFDEENLEDRNSPRGYEQHRSQPRGRSYEREESVSAPELFPDRSVSHSRTPEPRQRPRDDSRQRPRSRTPDPAAERYYRELEKHEQQEKKLDEANRQRRKAGTDRNVSTPALRDALGGGKRDVRREEGRSLWQPASRADVAPAGTPSGGRAQTPVGRNKSNKSSRNSTDDGRVYPKLPICGESQPNLPYELERRPSLENVGHGPPDDRMPSTFQRRRGSTKEQPMALYDPISHCWKLFPTTYCDDGSKSYDRGGAAGKPRGN